MHKHTLNAPLIIHVDIIETTVCMGLGLETANVSNIYNTHMAAPSAPRYGYNIVATCTLTLWSSTLKLYR